MFHLAPVVCLFLVKDGHVGSLKTRDDLAIIVPKKSTQTLTSPHKCGI